MRPQTLLTLKQVAELSFPTRWAHFRLLAFEGSLLDNHSIRGRMDTGLALILGDVYGSVPLVRIHSQCITGEVFHSLRCDCHDQLHLALRSVAEAGSGIIVY